MRKKKVGEVRHPRFAQDVTVEKRTGSGVAVRTVRRTEAFGGGSCRIVPCCCRPGIHRCMDPFYARIDRDLEVWQYETDLALRVPYAVKRHRWERRQKALVRRMERGKTRKGEKV